MGEKKSKTKKFLFANLGLGAEKDYLTEQLSLLLSSGMAISLALSAIYEELKSKKLKTIIGDISKDIESGSSISDALETTNIFPQHIISLIRVGEKSGRLTQNLKVVALNQQKERDFRGKIASSMMYPLFVFFLTATIGIGIAWFLLPRLAVIFSQLRIELPLITRILIAIGNFLGLHGAVVMPLVIVFSGLSIFFIFLFPKTNFLGQEILFIIAPIKRLLIETELARLGYILGNLLLAGLPIVEALKSISEASTLYRYKKLYNFLAEKISEGNSFQKSFSLYKKTSRVIPTPIQQLIISAELSGNLPEALIKIGEIYESKTETTTKNLAILLEPVVLVIVWLGVVAVALAVILPLYSLVGGLNKTTSSPDTVKTEEMSVTPQEGEIPISTQKRIEILDTEVGFLNVRTGPSQSFGILKQVTPGEIYIFIQKQDDWYQLQFENNTTGWVLGKYVQEIP